MKNVKDFGAVGDGLSDDYKAIQSAIDSIPTPTAAPGGKILSGGVVFLPDGVYKISQPLKLKSAVTLKGESVSVCLVADGDAIHLTTPFGHGYFIGGGVEDLSIYTEGGKGISIDTSIGAISATKIKNLHMECGSTCIDLLPAYSQDLEIDSIKAANGGSGILSISGNANQLNALNTEGSKRNFDLRIEKGVVFVKGAGNSITNCIIEGYPKGFPAYYFEECSQLSYRNNWMELIPGSDKISYVFDRVSGFIEDLHLIGTEMKAKFINCQNLTVNQLDLVGWGGQLSDTIVLDDLTSLKINHIYADFDAGLLDHPRLSVGSVFSKRNQKFLKNPIRLKNTIPANAFSTPAAWQYGPSGPNGTAIFTVSTDNAPGRMGRRLKIVVQSNPNQDNISVTLPLNVTADDTGTPAIAKYRLEGPSLIINWQIQGANWQQLCTRVMGSLTSCHMPLPLKTGDSLIFILNQAKVGTYYISDLEVGFELF